MKMLQYLGTPSRLIIIRNVNFIVEQQRLKTRAQYDRQLTNTLSHELLTPLNCIINLSQCLQEDQEVCKNPSQNLSLEEKEAEAEEKQEMYEVIWSSGKILEFTIKSMINRH